MSELRSRRLVLHPPSERDLPALARILAEPGVARYWPDFDEARIRAELILPEPDDVTVFALVHAGNVVGAIQYGEETDPQYRHASVDLFLAPSVWGKGLGPEAISTVLHLLFGSLAHHRVVIDPAADNTRAIRAYEKLGFRRVGLMRRYERGADGTWHDGVLMDLLVEEFVPADSCGGG